MQIQLNTLLIHIIQLIFSYWYLFFEYLLDRVIVNCFKWPFSLTRYKKLIPVNKDKNVQLKNQLYVLIGMKNVLK